MDNKIPAKYIDRKFRFLKIYQPNPKLKWSVDLYPPPDKPKNTNIDKLSEIKVIYFTGESINTNDYPNCEIKLGTTIDDTGCLIVSKIDESPNLKYDEQLEEYKEKIKIYNEEKLIYDELIKIKEQFDSYRLKEIRRAQYEELKKEFENA